MLCGVRWTTTYIDVFRDMYEAFTIYNFLKLLIVLLGGQNPQPSNPNSEPSNLNPQTSTLNLQPSNLNPQPSTLNSKPQILNPKP